MSVFRLAPKDMRDGADTKLGASDDVSDWNMFPDKDSRGVRVVDPMSVCW